jgi:hypothetical protein
MARRWQRLQEARSSLHGRRATFHYGNPEKIAGSALGKPGK